jgi:hypothetical protein
VLCSRAKPGANQENVSGAFHKFRCKMRKRYNIVHFLAAYVEYGGEGGGEGGEIGGETGGGEIGGETGGGERRRRKEVELSNRLGCYLILGNRPCICHRVAFLRLENSDPRSALALCHTG